MCTQLSGSQQRTLVLPSIALISAEVVHPTLLSHFHNATGLQRVSTAGQQLAFATAAGSKNSFAIPDATADTFQVSRAVFAGDAAISVVAQAHVIGVRRPGKAGQREKRKRQGAEEGAGVFQGGWNSHGLYPWVVTRGASDLRGSGWSVRLGGLRGNSIGVIVESWRNDGRAR